MGARNRPEMPYGWGRVGYSLEERLPWMNLPFEVSEYHQRIERLRGHMAQNGLDAIVVVGNRADNSNVRYLSNFEDFYGGESIVVVPAVGSPGFTTNAIMHGEPMHSGIQDCWIENARCAAAPRTVTGDADPVTIFDHVEDFINEGGAGNGRIGIVGEFNVGELEAFLKGRFPKATIKHAPTILYAMRAIKSPAEIAVMRKACHLADVGLQAVMDAVSPGVSEFDLSAEANYAMFKAGNVAMTIMPSQRVLVPALSTSRPPRTRSRQATWSMWISAAVTWATTVIVRGSVFAATRRRSNYASWKPRFRSSRK